MFNDTNIKLYHGLSLHLQVEILASDFYWDYVNSGRITEFGKMMITSLIRSVRNDYDEELTVDEVVNFTVHATPISDVDLNLQSDDTIRELLRIVQRSSNARTLRLRLQGQWLLRKLLKRVGRKDLWYSYLTNTPFERWDVRVMYAVKAMSCTTADDVAINNLLSIDGIKSIP